MHLYFIVMSDMINLRICYRSVSEHKEVAKLISMLTSSINSTKSLVSHAIQTFHKYSDIWNIDRDERIKEFLQSNPHLTEFKAEILHYQAMETQILEEQDRLDVGAVALIPEDLKVALQVETKAWKLIFGRALNQKYCSSMDHILSEIEDTNLHLTRNIKDLDDVRVAMGALKDLRANEITIDMSIGPIEEAYGMLNRYGITVSREDVEKVDTLRYQHKPFIYLTCTYALITLAIHNYTAVASVVIILLSFIVLFYYLDINGIN